MNNKVVAFGEMMLRLSPPGHQRFVQARSFDAIYGGAEANVAVSLANYGLVVDYVTRLPPNEIGDACLAYLRQFGVGTSKIVRGGERMGLYFMEAGAGHRPSKVIYDRADSALATVKPGDLDWHAIFSDADWFHWGGITPALSRSAAEVSLEAARAAREMGLVVSFDLNYRANLWRWGEPPSAVMPALVECSTMAVLDEEHAGVVFGVYATPSDSQLDRSRSICEQMAERFPSLKTIAITLRGSTAASDSTYSAALWERGAFYSAPSHVIGHIVDRIGGGDAFVGGLIYGLRTFTDPQRALDFGVAAACLKHSISGDFNLVSAAEVEQMLAGGASGRVLR